MSQSEEIFDFGPQESLVGIGCDIRPPEILSANLDIADGCVAKTDFRATDIAMRIGLITGRYRCGIGHPEVAQHDHETAWILYLHMLVVQLHEIAVLVQRCLRTTMGIQGNETEIPA